MGNPTNAAFSLADYSIVKASLDFHELPENCEFSIAFNPSGEYNQKNSEFMLTLECIIDCENNGKTRKAMNIILKATFKFNETISFEAIPPYFYSNSMAIVFPYVRAFISTLSLQANVRPIVLPTLNISTLNEALKNNTVIR